MELVLLRLEPGGAGGFGVKLAPAASQAGAAPRVLVREVAPGGPAEAAGLAGGDVVVGIAGMRVEWGTRLQAVLAQFSAAGQPQVEWAVWRRRADGVRPGSAAWCWAQFASRLLRSAEHRRQQCAPPLPLRPPAHRPAAP